MMTTMVKERNIMKMYFTTPYQYSVTIFFLLLFGNFTVKCNKSTGIINTILKGRWNLLLSGVPVCNGTNNLVCGKIIAGQTINEDYCLDQGCCFEEPKCFQKIEKDCNLLGDIKCPTKTKNETDCLASDCCFKLPTCFTGEIDKYEQLQHILYVVAACGIFALLISICVIWRVRKGIKNKNQEEVKKRDDLTKYLIELLKEPDEDEIPKKEG